jgi:predicted acylesterase/phospholipase RssA
VPPILASGSLPPGFPWTTIDGRSFWDGGIISNSPLDLVVDHCGAASKRVFIVDLFAGRKPLPKNLGEVLMRRDEILYAERIRNDAKSRDLIELAVMKVDGKWRINYRGGKEATAYYTTDDDDALGMARAMEVARGQQ